MNATRWLRTDPETDLISGLAMLNDLLPRTADDMHTWRWSIPILHSTVQGSLLPLLGTAQLMDRMDDRRAATLYAHIERQGDIPNMRMLTFNELIDRASERSTWRPSTETRAGLDNLNELRNSLAHPLFDQSVEETYLLRMLTSSLQALRTAVDATPVWNDEANLTRAFELIGEIERWVEST